MDLRACEEGAACGLFFPKNEGHFPICFREKARKRGVSRGMKIEEQNGPKKQEKGQKEVLFSFFNKIKVLTLFFLKNCYFLLKKAIFC